MVGLPIAMGDPTAKVLGRLSLNPLRHLDPVGTLMLFLFGFGWARPVPVNFSRIRDFRKGMILVSSAGIIANMILAFIALSFYNLMAFSRFKHHWKVAVYFCKDQHHFGCF